MSDKHCLIGHDSEGRSDAMRKAGKFGPEGAWTAPEWAEKGASKIVEASDNAARSAPSDAAAAPALLAPPGAGLRSVAPQAPRPSDPKQRSFPDPGNRAETSASDASRPAAAGAPSPAPSFPARGLHSGLISLPGAGPDRPADRPEDIPDSAGLGGRALRQTQAPGWPPGGAMPPRQARPPRRRGWAATAAPPRPTPARHPTRSAVLTEASGIGADGRKPEGAALETQASGANPPALLPAAGRLSGRLAALAETAKDYARSAQADNTQRAYAADWRQFASWLRRQGLAETPPDPEAVGLYLAAQVERRGAELSVCDPRAAAVRHRLALPAAAASRSISATAISPLSSPASAGGTAALPSRKPRSSPTSFWRMLATLDMDLRGLRDRAILAIGFAGGLRRSEIVGLDCGPGQTEDGSGWIEIFPEGALLTIRGKTGWREVEIGRGSRPDTCPVALLETWMRLGRIARGPLFRAIARKNGGISGERLTDKHVVRLVQKCALAAGLRGDLAEGERRLAFGGHSLRAGLASSAQIEEAHVQKHLGHASAEMTRRYQRKRDRFTINLTKAAGL